VTLHGDHEPEMTPSWQMDDDIVEAIFSDEPVDDTFAPLVAFTRSVRAVGERAAPRPTRELAELLEGIQPTGTRPVAVSPATTGPAATGRSRLSKRRYRVPVGIAALAGKVASLGLAGKLGLGVAGAAVGGVAAGATGVAPAPVNDAVQSAITTATPINIDSTNESNVRADVGDTASVGAEVSPEDGAQVGANVETDEVVGTATSVVGGVAGTATGAVNGVVDGTTETVDGVVDETLDLPNQTPVGGVLPDDLPDLSDLPLELPSTPTLPTPSLPELPGAQVGVGADTTP
jgi:hypothetical protein